MVSLKVLIVGDFEPFLKAVSTSLQKRPEFKIFEALARLEAVEKAKELQPDLILLNIGSPKLNGIEAARKMRRFVPHAKLLCVSQESSPNMVRKIFNLGAQGCVHLQSSADDLAPAIEAVLRGERFISNGLDIRDTADAQSSGEDLALLTDTADLRKKEEIGYYRAAIVESSDDAIVLEDLDGVIFDWNSAANRIFGYTAQEAIGHSITIIVPPDLYGEEEQILRRLRDGQYIDHYETRRVTKDGRTVEVSLTVSPVKNAEGRIIGASKIARDITEIKRSDAALRESEELFRLAMNNFAAGLYTLDLEGLVTYVNPAAEAMFGWTHAELLGRKMHDVTHYKHPDGTPFPASDCPGLQIFKAGIEVREHEDMFIRKDGSFFPVVYSASPLNRDGKAVGIVVGFRDDTLRREAERAMRESEERFRLVANAAPVMIWMSGVDKLCTYFNQGWLEFTGRPLEAELGNGWAEGIHPEDFAGCLELYEKAFDRREPFRMEYRLRRNDGEYCWVFDQGIPRFNADGSFAGFIGSAIDVTELKLAREALSRVSQRLIEAQEGERRWIARELHDDISQRLAAQMLSLERLSVQSTTPEIREGIAKIIQKTATLDTDLRALSHRLHSSNLEQLGLAAAASGYCSELSGQYKVEINFHSKNIPAHLPWEVSLCLFRILQEALQNAVKHSGSRRFQVSLNDEPNEIDLKVQDSGIGFIPEEAIKVPGLGLTSMRERLKLVNGKLSIASQLGHGTTIHAQVPVRKKSDGASAS